MKKYLFIVVALVATMGGAIAQTSKGKQDKKTTKSAVVDPYVLSNFRDITWGSHIDSIYVDGVKINFIKSTELGDRNAYSIAGDDMMIGTVILKTLYYVFNSNNRFVGVIMTGDSKQLGEMKYILVNKFGKPSKEDETVSGKQYYWNVDDVRISLINESINQLFTVDFTSDYEISESKKINRNVDDF
jgi:hypothetical protein